MQRSAKIRLVGPIAFAFSALLPAQTPPVTQQAAHRAEVTYAAGQLSVIADNSSLNQILRDIARETGMKITGGVADQRVFGQYGPAAPAKVLNTLLDGTGSNMLLLQATTTKPAELILTARQGEPSPPNPNASAEDNSTFNQQNQTPPPARQQYPPPTSTIVNAPGNPAAANPTQSPNAVKTPQQIYEQLQRMRQQQQQSNPQ